MINKTGRIGKMFSSYGLAQIPLLIGLLIMAVAVPVATKLVEENQDTRNLAATCIAEGQIVYSGATCCTGLVKTGCVSAGSFSYCYCTKPATNPTATPATKSCTVRNCVNYKCASSTTTVPSNQACPTSNCTTVGATCGNPPTAVPTVKPTAVATIKPTTVPTASPTCGALGQSCCLQEYVGSTPIYNKCNAGLYCNGGKCSTTPVPSATTKPTSTPVPTTYYKLCQTCSTVSYPNVPSCSQGCPGGVFYVVNNQGVGVCGTELQCPKPTTTPVVLQPCSTNGCTTKGATSTCTVSPSYPGVTPGTGSKVCNLNVISNCLTWSECKLAINPTAKPTISCSSITNATECGYTPGCYWYNNKCTNVKPTIGIVTLTPKPTVSCSNITNATECGYTPGCYWYNNKCTNVKPTIGIVTLTPAPFVKCCPKYDTAYSKNTCTGASESACKTNSNYCIAYGGNVCPPMQISGSPTGPVITQPPVLTQPPGEPTKPPVTGTSCKEVLTGNLLQCCHPPDSDGTSDDSLCNRAGRVATCGGKDYCCPTLNGNWTTDMSKCNLKCTLCANGKNRSIGDADCNGVVDVNDRSIWSSEFVSDGGKGTVKNNWMSDFDCNGVVDVNDRSIWSANFKI